MASNGKKNGGKRPGAGRKPGSKSAATKIQRGQLGERAREYSDLALQTLADVCKKSDSDAAKVSASTALLDRGFGKPAQSHEHTGAGGGPISFIDLKTLTDDQLAALEPVLAALAASGAATERGPG